MSRAIGRSNEGGSQRRRSTSKAPAEYIDLSPTFSPEAPRHTAKQRRAQRIAERIRQTRETIQYTPQSIEIEIQEETPANAARRQEARRIAEMIRRTQRQRDVDVPFTSADFEHQQPEQTTEGRSANFQEEAEYSRRRRDISKGKQVAMEDENTSEDPDYEEGSGEEEGSIETTGYYSEFKKSFVNEGVPQADTEEGKESGYLEALLSRGFKGTRFPHRPTMESLGIERDITYLLRLAGIEKLVTTYSDAYQVETCHFLATLQQQYDDDDLQAYITFSVRGKEYALALSELDHLYGFPTGRDDTQNFAKNEFIALWNTIASDDYSSSKAKSGSIRSPVLRYLHKSIATTMYAREITGYVNSGEMGMLDLALKPLLRYTSDGCQMKGDRNDAGLSYILINHLMTYKEWALGLHEKGSTGTLTVGGIVTPILRACNVPLKSKGQPARWIDMSYLKNAHFFHGPKYKQLYTFVHPGLGASRLQLPNIQVTTIMEGNNIDFQPSRDVLQCSEDRVVEQTEGGVQHEDAYVPEGEELGEPECYYFEEAPTTKKGKSLATAHKNIGKLQGWNKYQDGFFKRKIKEMTKQIKRIALKVSKSSSSHKTESPSRHTLERSHSTTVVRREPRIEQPSRHSSVDPETMQRRKRHHFAQEDVGVERGVEPRKIQQEEQPEATRPNDGYTAESMDEYISSSFFIPY